MFHNLKSNLNFFKFNIAVRAILNTSPIACDRKSSVVCVSHVSHRYIYAYLVAIKSFAMFVTPGKIYVIDDLSMTKKDKDLLKAHIKGIEMLPITSIKNKNCPSGADWEGFLLIGELARDNYCILIDADTITIDNIYEVNDSIDNNKSFTLGNWRLQKAVSMEEARETVKLSNNNHVQVIAEKNLDKLSDYEKLKYIRGCGGFAGFSKGSSFRSEIEEFSEKMKTIIGAKKWAEWGSQQVASNYIIANNAGSIVLPFPKYASFEPGLDLKESCFLHFIGTHRFKNGIYVEIANNVTKNKMKAIHTLSR